jgi:hypothetical protein
MTKTLSLLAVLAVFFGATADVSAQAFAAGDAAIEPLQMMWTTARADRAKRVDENRLALCHVIPGNTIPADDKAVARDFH